MIDIETLDTTTNSVILSIAAVKFNMNDDLIETFYQNVTPQSCIKLGMTNSEDTVRWWSERPKSAQESVLVDQISIKEALIDLTEFTTEGVHRKAEFWAHGIMFDYGNLENAMTRCGLQHPWEYYQISDTRTLFKACKLDWKNYPRVGTHHNALDDCLTQIKALKEEVFSDGF